MAMPKVLDWLDDLVAKVATNTTNIATNKANIAANKKSIDDHKKDDVRHWTTADRQNFNRVVHFKGYFTTIQALKTAYPTGQVGDYGIVGETDTVWLWDDTKNEWLNSTEQGIVISVNGRTGEVILTKTDVGLSNVDNTSDKNKPISDATQKALDDKADRKKATLAQADSVTGLRSGIYYVSESKTILGTTTGYWTVIVGEMSKTEGATQIWMPYTSNGTTKMFFRRQQMNTVSNTRVWSDFVEVLTSLHLATLNTDITQMKKDIKANADDIDTLELDKADRKLITVAQADGMELRSGLYYVRESKTILGFTSSGWTLVVNEQNNGTTYYNATQMWMNTTAGKNRIFFRQFKDITTKEWYDFIEILTTDIATRDDITRFKQYKGYFADKTALETKYTTAKDGDYAIVGNALYIWNSESTKWTEVSGSGGSGGVDKWSVKRYATPAWTQTDITRYLRELQGLTLEKQWEIDDTADFLLNESAVEYKAFLFETFVKMEIDTQVSASVSNDDSIALYINGKLIYEKSSRASNIALTLDLKQGWNKIQVLLSERTGEEYFKLGVAISQNENCLMMDCYHNYDTIVDNMYVPYVGDSIIEGNIQVTKTIGITNKSYLKYNEEDDSLSFMFDDNMDM